MEVKNKEQIKLQNNPLLKRVVDLYDRYTELYLEKYNDYNEIFGLCYKKIIFQKEFDCDINSKEKEYLRKFFAFDELIKEFQDIYDIIK